MTAQLFTVDIEDLKALEGLTALEAKKKAHLEDEDDLPSRRFDYEDEDDLPSRRFDYTEPGVCSINGVFYLDPDAYDELEIVAHVERIDVDLRYRGEGRARRMLEALAAHCTIIYAAAGSEAAAAFWEHMGGETVDETLWDRAWTSFDVGYGVYRLRTYSLR